MSLQDYVAFMLYLANDNDYKHPQPCAADVTKWKAIAQFAFTWGIVTGPMFDRCTVSDRWCYHSYEDALKAFEAWDGTGEPEGWHRHPMSGRRRNHDTGEQWINP
jgi:hypothetical protein